MPKHPYPSPSTVAPIPTSAHRLIDKGAPESHSIAAQKLLDLEPGGSVWVAELNRAINAVSDLSKGGQIYMTGERGIGKTQIAVCVMLDQIDVPDPYTHSRASIRYIRAAEMFMAFRDALRSGGERRVVNELTRPRILVIDDIHEQAGSDHEQRSLTLLMDKRLGAGRITLLLSNLKPKALANAIGPSVADRFFESGVLLQVKGENLRRSK